MSAPDSPATLVVVHYHLRSGGIRRVIERGLAALARHNGGAIRRFILATGEPAENPWLENLQDLCGRIPVEERVEPSLGYISEMRTTNPGVIRARTRRFLSDLLSHDAVDSTLVWAHNLGLARNVILAEELAAACERSGAALLSLHHDLWFDNRWVRWREARATGYADPDRLAAAIFPVAPRIVHAAINREDYRLLRRGFGPRAAWLPNSCDPPGRPNRQKIRAARAWLEKATGLQNGAPRWLMPVRLLRRKNVAEALLLARWLHPHSQLVTSGGVSSEDERPYAEQLARAASTHDWPLHLSVLETHSRKTPGIDSLIAASDGVFLTSLQEGFGLAYLEAASWRRPLVCRKLPNIMPDLRSFGMRFHHAYTETRVATELFDAALERKRQTAAWRQWRSKLPQAFRKLARPPVLLLEKDIPRTVPFSRLTLEAQIEVLAADPDETFKHCAASNRFLKPWREELADGPLRHTVWPEKATAALSGETYCRRFYSALQGISSRKRANPDPAAVQAGFIAKKLSTANLYPILMTTD